MTAIEDVINIGPRLGEELRRVGVSTLEDLKGMGYLEAWRRLQGVSPERNCTNSCLALAGAIAGVRWMKLPKPVRARISREAKEGRGKLEPRHLAPQARDAGPSGAPR